MKKINIIVIPLLMLLLCSYNYSVPKRTNNYYMKCYAGALIDQDSGRVLFSKNGNTLLPMASTTKIMTAIVAIEKGKLSDIVTVSGRAASIKGSLVGLKAGEKISLEELIYGLMLRSGNDAAIAIAEHIGGSIPKFAELMNEKAMEIGAYNTNFITPHGLDAENHYTTAEDLAKITAYALKNPFFARVASAKIVSSGINGPFNRTYSNINKFLYRFSDADGVKTGYTGRAGKCLVASIKHRYGRYISVVLNSSDRWNDAAKMIEVANEKYKYIQIYNKGTVNKNIRVYGGKIKFVDGKINKDLYMPVLKNNSENLDLQTFVPSALFSPINENETIGNIVVFINDKIIAKYPILCSKEVERRSALIQDQNKFY